ncbi:putative enzyme related to lactoylglutathione lyase [Xenorhabdus cabanillasii]|uniref:Putative enzyme related to lactoylglutathione lyase n=1 Tax=Xenorhabdus cabanillasii TaxID=351673 RepID=A0A3D9UI30_9GAMM|nr:VOC family protein [Xenorhabdus cabanillasii]REF27600.1 putative enzyme related to lactoylglutathione lyase [Xenorhabdus cabanillasii]
MLTNILTDDLASTSNLFANLLNFNIEYKSDWFITMSSGAHRKISAFLRTSEFIPELYQKPCQGLIITFVVKDVEPYLSKAKTLTLELVEPPRDLPYGQRRLLIKDKSGALIDISAPTAPLDRNYG